jgi:hypothetical protein
MGIPEDFDWVMVGGEVRIHHHGRPVTTLRGAAAARLLERIEDDEPQAVMARVTGNYKRGNERVAKNHPRNQRR